MRNKLGGIIKNYWRLTLSLGKNPITGKRLQKARTFRGTKTEARRALEDFRREYEMGLKYDADKVIFKDYANQWLEARQASERYAKSTIKRNRQIISVLNSYLGNILLKNIDAPMVRKIYIELQKQGRKETTVNKYAVVLNQIMNQAMRDNLILRNPCQLVDSPRQIKSTVGESLTLEQVSNLVKRLDDLENKTYPYQGDAKQKVTANKCHSTVIKLILATGIRRGEALALSWQHVDLKNSEIHIRCTLDGDNKPKTTKTQSGIRDIAIDSTVVTMLSNWRQMQKDYLNTLGIEQGKETPVFTSEAGGYIDGHNFARWWHLFKKDSEFESLRIHDLRHTHATILVSSGLNLKAVSSRLGHANIGITLDLYAHAQKEDDIRAAQILGNVLNL